MIAWLTAMLERLDEIPWASLHHAYGPAGDVPGALRSLVHSDEASRREAIDLLYSSIWHQGTIYEATSHAVPFLVELVLARECADRAAVAWLIGDIALGTGYWTVHDPTRTADVARELEHERAAQLAIRNRLPALIALLDDPDEELRLAAAFVVTCFPDARDVVVPRLRAALAHGTGARERATLGLSLALLGDLATEAFDSDWGGPGQMERLRRFAARLAGDGGRDPEGDGIALLRDALAMGGGDPAWLREELDRLDR